MKSQPLLNFSKYNKKYKYVKFACDLETSSEYHIKNKPYASKDQKSYDKWKEKTLNCKAWVYLYCAIQAGSDKKRYLLEIDFKKWLDKIVYQCKKYCKTHKINLWFHNLKYDGSFLLFELHKLKYDFCNNKELSKKLKNYTALIDAKTKNIYTIKFWYENYFFKVQCSLNLMRCSIADVLYAKKEKEVKIEHLPNIKYKSLALVPKNVIDYIKQDCYAITIIWKILRDIKKNSYHTKNKLSIGGWAKEAAYLAFHKSKWYKKNKKILEISHWNFEKDEKIFNILRQDYHGGLTGLNKSFCNENNFIEIEGNIKTYDINSAYPYIMKNPIPYMKPLTKANEKDFLIQLEITKIENPKVLKTFWLFHEFFEKKKRLFLIWNFEWELIKKLMNLQYRVLKKYYFNYAPVYEPFINKMNELKEKYSQEQNNAENDEKKIYYGLLRRTVKLLMNSPYGKEAQKEYTNVLITKDYLWLDWKDEKQKIQYTNICGASFITAKTRSMILELLIKYPNNVLYWDTDCVHVLFNDELSQAQFEKSIKINEFELGSWKLEIEADYAKYLKKKCYALMKKDGSIKFKTAGYNFNNETFNWTDFFRGNEVADISLYSYRNRWNQIILSYITKKL